MYKKSGMPLYCDTFSVLQEERLQSQPERRLWKAVILNAISDALKKSEGKYTVMHKNSALSWLLYDEVNFNQVCELAGLHCKTTRVKLKQYLLRNTNIPNA